MTAPGADPAAGGPRTGSTAAQGPTADGGDEPASLHDRIAEALRPANLPLPSPRGVVEAVHRIRDLTAQGRLREARLLADVFSAEPAELDERVELLRAHAEALELGGDAAGATAVLRELVGLVDGSGHHDHARALVLLLGLAGRPVAPDAAARRGRRRADPLAAVAPEDVDDAVLVVVQGILDLGPDPVGRSAPGTSLSGTYPSDISPAGTDPTRPGIARLDTFGPHDLERAEGRLLSALEALGAVHREVVGDPEPALRLRLAQVLEADGRPEEATRQAGFVLDAVDGPDDLARSASGAHALLSRTLRASDPFAALEHAIAALDVLRDVDEPAERALRASDLVLCLVAADLPEDASYAARRLASLVHAVPREEDRLRPLLVVAAQRIASGREDLALGTLAQVRRMARDARDHGAALQADQLLGQAHHRAGRTAEAITALRSAARESRWLSDDLLATDDVRRRFLVSELEARAMVQRIALEDARHAEADAEGSEIIRRADRVGGRLLPPGELWDHVVDAAIGRMIATGLALAAGEDGADRATYMSRRREARRLIDTVPDGHEDRARFWSVYLTDRDAAMLAARGDLPGARKAAAWALDGWARLGEAEHVERLTAEIARLADREADLEHAEVPAEDGDDPASATMGTTTAPEPGETDEHRRP